MRFNAAAVCTAVAIAISAGTVASPAQGSTPLAASAAAKTRGVASFTTPPSVGVECTVGDRPGRLVGVDCRSVRQRPLYRQRASLRAGGRTVLCRERGSDDHCRVGKRARSRAKALGVGRSVTVGRFGCRVQRNGVRCTLRSSGKGFLINRTRLAAVGGGGRGGAGRGPLLHLKEFLSPDRKVWCATEEASEEEEGQTFCGTGISVSSDGILHEVFPQSLAELNPKGVVKICFIAGPPPPGTPKACLQNWNGNAPVLQYGQQSEAGGVLCTSARNGITCTASAGAGRGKGFRVSATEAVRARR